MGNSPSDVLIVKFGGVGGFVNALPAMAAIRRSHRGARIVLLTDPDLAVLAEHAPYFDDVIAEDAFDDARGAHRVSVKLRGERFANVFDLEGGPRSERVYNVLKPFGVMFASTVRSARRRIDPRELDGLHAIDAALARVAAAGVPPAGAAIPDVRWAVTARRGAPSLRPAFFGLKSPYVLLGPDAPGGVRDGAWPLAHFARLAAALAAQGVGVAVASAADQRATARAIAAACPAVCDLGPRADYVQLAALAAAASGAFGHAGGELMPLIAAAGAPTLVMVTSHADAGVAVRGRSVISILAPHPEALSPAYAAQAVGMFTHAPRLQASA